jgi:hypothetical protein
MQKKNRKKYMQHTYGLYQQLQKVQLKTQSTFRETKKINYVVNSASFG